MTQANHYEPPSPAIFYELARRTCEHCAATHDDPSMAGHDMVHGMAQFLRAAAYLLADNLNRQLAEVDIAA